MASLVALGSLVSPEGILRVLHYERLAPEAKKPSTGAKTAMWDESVPAILFIVLMGSLAIYWGLTYLNEGDRFWNRVSQCPPHEWAPQYRDPTEAEKKIDPALTHVYSGLRCGKCKRMPNQIDGPSMFNSGPWGTT